MAATSAESGNPIYPPVRRQFADHGISCQSKTAWKMRAGHYGRFALIIGMDQENLYDVCHLCGSDYDSKIHLLMDDTDRPGNVAVPWYTGNFEASWVNVEEGWRELLGWLERGK